MKTNEVFPTLPGLMWNRVRYPTFKTAVQQAMSGREYRIPFMEYPLWKWELSFEFLRDDATNELRTLVGFFLRHLGRYRSFRYLDLDDYLVSTPESIGLAGSRPPGSQVQLLRTYESFIEPVTDPQPGFSVFNGGVLSPVWNDAFGTGVITNSSTTTGALTWTGSFWHRVRFEEDETQMEQFLEKLWSAKRVSLVSAR